MRYTDCTLLEMQKEILQSNTTWLRGRISTSIARFTKQQEQASLPVLPRMIMMKVHFRMSCAVERQLISLGLNALERLRKVLKLIVERSQT